MITDLRTRRSGGAPGRASVVAGDEDQGVLSMKPVAWPRFVVGVDIGAQIILAGAVGEIDEHGEPLTQVGVRLQPETVVSWAYSRRTKLPARSAPVLVSMAARRGDWKAADTARIRRSGRCFPREIMALVVVELGLPETPCK